MTTLVEKLRSTGRTIKNRVLPIALSTYLTVSGIQGCAGSKPSVVNKKGELILQRDSHVDSSKTREVYGPPAPKKNFLEGMYTLPEDDLLLWAAKRYLLELAEDKLKISGDEAAMYRDYVDGLDPSSEEGSRDLKMFFVQYFAGDEWDPTTPKSEIDAELRRRIDCAKREKAVHLYVEGGVKPPISDIYDGLAEAILEDGCPFTSPVIRVDEDLSKMLEEKKEVDAQFPNGKRAWFSTNPFGRFESIPIDIEEGAYKKKIDEAEAKYGRASTVGDFNINNPASKIRDVGMIINRAKEGRVLNSGDPDALIKERLVNVNIMPFPDCMDFRRYRLSVNVLARNKVFLSGDSAQIIFTRYGAYSTGDTLNSITLDSIPFIANVDTSNSYFAFNFPTKEIYVKRKSPSDLITFGLVLKNSKGESFKDSKSFDFSRVNLPLPILWGIPIASSTQFSHFENYIPLAKDGEFNVVNHGDTVKVLFPVEGISPDSLGHYMILSRLDLVPADSREKSGIVNVGKSMSLDSSIAEIKRSLPSPSKPPLDVQSYMAFSPNSQNVMDFVVPSNLSGEYIGIISVFDLSKPKIIKKKVRSVKTLAKILEEENSQITSSYQPLEFVKFNFTIKK